MTRTDDRTVDAYAADVEATRARIAATIDTLQERLQPRMLATQAAESLMGSAITGLAGSGTTLLVLAQRLFRNHPIAIAGTGLGLAVALLARRSLSHAEVDMGDDYEPYSDFDDGYAPRIADTGNVDTPGVIAESPLTAVLAGLAAGALIGALFPETAAEDKLVGQHSDRVSAAARAAAKAARSEFLGRD